MLKSTQPDTAPSTFVQKDWFSVKLSFLNNDLNNMKCLRRQKWDDLMEHRMIKENLEVPSQRKDFSPETLSLNIMTFESLHKIINSEVWKINVEAGFCNWWYIRNIVNIPPIWKVLAPLRANWQHTTNIANIPLWTKVLRNRSKNLKMRSC